MSGCDLGIIKHHLFIADCTRTHSCFLDIIASRISNGSSQIELLKQASLLPKRLFLIKHFVVVHFLFSFCSVKSIYLHFSNTSLRGGHFARRVS